MKHSWEMFIPDLTVFPPDHPPSPYGSAVLSQGEKLGDGFCVLPSGLRLFAVGWLGARVDSRGPSPDECIECLFDAYERGWLVSDGTMGWHDCEICSHCDPLSHADPVVHWRDRELRLYGHGHHLVQLDDRVYMCPALILHYILDHRYRPPDEFTSAVAHGDFLTVSDLRFIAINEIKKWWVNRGGRTEGLWGSELERALQMYLRSDEGASH